MLIKCLTKPFCWYSVLMPLMDTFWGDRYGQL